MAAILSVTLAQPGPARALIVSGTGDDVEGPSALFRAHSSGVDIKVPFSGGSCSRIAMLRADRAVTARMAFAAGIANWSEVGGADLRFRLVRREDEDSSALLKSMGATPESG